MQHILITGSNRGIGYEFTRQYLEKGDRVFATCRDPEATQLKNLISKFPQQLSIVKMDVADSKSIEVAFSEVSHESETLDLLINNAGVYSAHGSKSPQESLGRLDFDEALSVMRINAIGPLVVAQKFMDLLHKSGHGKIVCLTSGYGSVSNNTSGFPYYYSASKAALNQLTRSLAAEIRKWNMAAVVVDPGWVATDMGGHGAPISPAESVQKMIEAIERLSSKDNGQYLDRFGNRQNW